MFLTRIETFFYYQREKYDFSQQKKELFVVKSLGNRDIFKRNLIKHSKNWRNSQFLENSLIFH